MSDTNPGAKPDGTTPGAKPETTQDDGLNDGGKRALDAERKARREADAEVKRLQERNAELERADVLRDVAATKGLSSELAQRLKGSTREELETDADALLAVVAPKETTGLNDRPKEALHSGASSTDMSTQQSVAEIAAEVLR